jgi:predicted N-formylglutamate amidohydrolase
MPERVERISIPGNAGLSQADRSARAAGVHDPFHRRVAEVLDGFDVPPALVTVHSFAPVWFGVPRRVGIGLLHDADETLAVGMLRRAGTAVPVALNEPYSAADGVTYTLAQHALPRGLQNVMIEVRNDLLTGAPGVDAIADLLAPMLAAALTERAGRA